MSIELGIYTLFFTVYGIIASVYVMNGYRLQRKKEEAEQQRKDKISPDAITVIIPFRNEAHRISGLLDSVNNLQRLPHKFLFVDDHSDDQTAALIEERLSDLIPFEVLRMNGAEAGKKAAIRAASEKVETKYTLTWDADIRLEANYFEQISELAEADMYVLPAILKPSNALQSIYELDVVLANAVNTGLAGMYRPIFASGANLLYATDSFKKYDSYDAHRNVSSGDDTFLLRDFTKAGAEVHLHTSPELAIITETPQSFGEYIGQRLRWVSKTKALNDSLNTSTAWIQLLLSVGFFAMLLLPIFNQNWLELWWLIGGKIVLDMFFFYPYFKRIRRISTWWWIPIYEIWFPFYSLLIALLIPFYKPKWKGRTVKIK